MKVHSYQPGTAPGPKVRRPSPKGRKMNHIPGGPSPAGIGRDLHSEGCAEERRAAPQVHQPLKEDFVEFLRTPESLVASEAVDSADVVVAAAAAIVI